MPATTQGTLVLIEPVCEVQVPRKTVLDVLGDGNGPVNTDGSLRRGYFFPMDAESALELLRRAGIENVDEPHLVDRNQTAAQEQFVGGASDLLTTTVVRAEQRFLRGQQIWRWGSSCCLCGRGQ